MKLVTMEVATRDRYDTLVLTLEALAFQTFVDFDVLVIDDSPIPKDLRTLPAYQTVFQLLNQHGINWSVQYGRRLGPAHAHQMAQEIATTKFCWRVDDDAIPRPDVLWRLISQMKDDVGAVGGLVLLPNAAPRPANAANIITDLNRPNLQWSASPDTRIQEVDHLYSSYLYRRGIAKYELGLSPAGFREETLHTFAIKRAGYKVLLEPRAVTYHFPGQTGGIRSYPPEFYEADEKLFQAQLAEWGVHAEPVKIIIGDFGKGDSVILKSLIPDLKRKYKKLLFATCYPEIFYNDDIEQISISEAKQRFGNLERWNLYKFCIDNNWTESLEKAMRKMYDI